MLNKTPGAISCAHCRGPAAAVSCRSCSLAAISPDGRFVALARQQNRVAVHDLDGDTAHVLGEHTDSICHLAFADDGALISADDDNRVIIRPRLADRFAALV